MPKAKPPRPAINAARNVPPRKRTVKVLNSRPESMMLAPNTERAALAWRGPHLTGRLRYPRHAMITYRYGVLKPPRKQIVETLAATRFARRRNQPLIEGFVS